MTTSRATKRTQKSDDNEAGLVHSIYRISLGKLFPVKSDGSDTPFDEIKGAFDDIIGVVEEGQATSEKEGQYRECQLDPKKIYISKNGESPIGVAFYVKNPNKESECVNFYQSFLKDKTELEDCSLPYTFSSILLIQTQKQNLYAVTTGFARHAIKHIIEQGFGLKVLGGESKSVEISSRSVNPLEGVVHSRYETYNQILSINNIKTSAALIGKVTGRLRLKKSGHLDALKNSKNKNPVRFSAKDHIQISVRANLRGLYRLLQWIDEQIENAEFKDPFNDIERCTDEKLIWKLIVNTFKEFLNSGDSKDFYIFPQEDEISFLTADSYQLEHTKNYLECDSIMAPPCQVRQTVKKWMREEKINEENFLDFIDKVKIKLKTEDGNDKDKEFTLRSCLNGYVRGKGGPTYVLRHGELYKYPESMMESLKNDVDIFLKDILLREDLFAIKGKHIAGDDENTLLDRLHAPEKGIYKLHKQFLGIDKSHKRKGKGVAKVELADLITKKGEKKKKKYYFAHFKTHFDCSMRILQKQIEISIHTLLDTLRNDEKKLKTYETEENRPPDSFFADLGEYNFEYIAAIIVEANKSYKSPSEYITNSQSIPAFLCLKEIYTFCVEKGIKLHLMLLIRDKETKSCVFADSPDSLPR